jgi:hypothetical protein
MSFIELDGLGEVKESQLHPEGPANLAISFVGEPYQNDKGRTVIKVVCQIEEEGDWMAVNHFLALPMGDDEESTKEALMRNTARFLHLVGCPIENNGFDPNDMAGTRFQANLMQSEPSADGVVYNNIVLPRLPQEEE